MQAFGNIATPIERRTARGSGKPFYTFRLGENQGTTDANRTTTWYDVTAFIDELDADLLSVGQFVKVTGRLEVQAFSRRDGSPGASATLLAFAIDPVERKAPAPGTENQGAPEQRGSAPSTRQAAPEQRGHAEQRQAPPAQRRPPSGFDDFDDDIPF